MKKTTEKIATRKPLTPIEKVIKKMKKPSYATKKIAAMRDPVSKNPYGKIEFEIKYVDTEIVKALKQIRKVMEKKRKEADEWWKATETATAIDMCIKIVDRAIKRNQKNKL